MQGRIKSKGERQPRPRKPPKVISPGDPSSAWTAKANKRVQFGYGLNYLIDVEHAVIVDVEATPARTYDEVAATRTMIERTRRRFDLTPKRLAADTAYGTSKFLAFVVSSGIIPHIPVWDKNKRDDGTFPRSEFRFDSSRNVYICPAGKTLTTSGKVHSDHAIRYFASVPCCRECPLKQKCCPNMPSRGIVRDVNEPVRDMARRKIKTKAFLISRDQRKRVEMRFAHLKTHHGFERMRREAFPGHTTSSISPPSCKISRPWRSDCWARPRSGTCVEASTGGRRGWANFPNAPDIELSRSYLS